MALSQQEFDTFDQDRYLRSLFTNYGKGPFRKGAGYGVFGYDYVQGLLDHPEDMAKLHRFGGEKLDEWLNRIDREYPGFKAQFQTSLDATNLNAKTDVFGKSPVDQRFKDWLDYDTLLNGKGQTPAEAKAADDDAKRAETMRQIEDFAGSLLKPLDASDPEVQRLTQVASNSASTQARLQGVQGPMSVANSELATNTALAGYNMDRKQLAMQALAQKNNSELQQWQIQSQAARQKWEDDVGLSELRKSKDPTQYITGGVGAAIGGVGGFFAGGPAGAAAGAGAGWNIGRGLGQGVSSGGYVPPPPRRSYYGGY